MQKILFSLAIIFLSISINGQSKINQTLKKELDSILIEDQKFRELISSELLQTKADSIAASFKIPINELTNYIVKMIPLTDSLNLERVEQIIKQYGYPGKSLVGKGTNEATYFVIQHSNKIDQYLPLIKKAVDKKELAFTLYAMMLDRSLMYNGKEQIYGTQAKGIHVLNKETGKKEFKYVIWPIENNSSVNQRRKKAGFTSTVEYYAKQNLGIEYTVLTLEDIKKMEGQ